MWSTARGCSWAGVVALLVLLAGCGSDAGPSGDSSTRPDDAGIEDGGIVLDDSTVPDPDGQPPFSKCGNGKLDALEQCDGQELNDMTCEALGYTGGELKCTADCKLDPSACQGTPQGQQFGQKCGGSFGDCAEGLLCVLVESGSDVGFCTAECSDTKPCPPLPKGAECVFEIGDGRTICGFLCSPDDPICPPDLNCGSDAAGNHYCTTAEPTICGDGTIQSGEDCDGINLGGKTCELLGYDGGKLECSGSCKFDTSGCTGTPTGGKFGDLCGDGIGDCLPGLMCVIASVTGSNKGFCTQACSEAEPCPTSPPGAACAFQISDGTAICGFLCDPISPSCPSGMACTQISGGYACTTDPPPVCGNNTVEIGEDCDGSDLNNMSCLSFGYGGGTLKCSNCKFDMSSCTGQSSCNLPPLACTAGNAACSKLELMDASGDGWVRGHPPEWSYARHDALMIFKYAAAAVACLMPGSLPIHSFDMSDKYGDIPKYDYSTNTICYQQSATCQLRHPEGTHVNGLDIDSSYFQTQGMANPGAVCTHTINGQDQYHCVEDPLPPKGILDAPRTALMLGKMFESTRIRIIGCDGKIGPHVETEAKKLAQQGLITTFALNNFKLAYEVTNQGYGWYHFHHHHFHASHLSSAYPTTSMPPPGVLPWADQAQPSAGYEALEPFFSDSPFAASLSIVHPTACRAGLCDLSQVPLASFDRDPYATDVPRIELQRWHRLPLVTR